MKDLAIGEHLHSIVRKHIQHDAVRRARVPSHRMPEACDRHAGLRGPRACERGADLLDGDRVIGRYIDDLRDRDGVHPAGVVDGAGLRRRNLVSIPNGGPHEVHDRALDEQQGKKCGEETALHAPIVIPKRSEGPGRVDGAIELRFGMTR